MKIRIFALAKELDIDSKELIEHCAKAGITIKNSALASISPEERDRVLEVMRSVGASNAPPIATATAVAPPPATSDTAAASRDLVVELAAKARPIRVMGAKPPLTLPRLRTPEVEPPKAAPPAAVAPAPVAKAPVAKAPVESLLAPPKPISSRDHARPRSLDSSDSSSASRIAAAEKKSEALSPKADLAPTANESAVVEVAEVEPEIEATEELTDTVEAVVDDVIDTDVDKPRPGSSPTNRSDFVTPSLPQKKMRDMVSRGTAELGAGGKATAPPIKRSKAAGPLIAEIPRFKAPSSVKTPKPEEATPQKPVQRFNVEGPTKETPLGTILRKRPDSAVKKKVGDDETEEGKVKKHVGGASLQEARNQRRKVSLKDIDEEEDRGGRGSRVRPKPHRRSGPVPLKSTAELELPLTVRSLSEGIGRPAKAIMQILWQRGDMVTINSSLEEEVAVE